MPPFDFPPTNRPRRIEHAYVAPDGTAHLPIHDEPQIRAAIEAFAGTPFHDPRAREEARRLILRAAGRYGIAVPKESGVRRRQPNRRAL